MNREKNLLDHINEIDKKIAVLKSEEDKLLSNLKKLGIDSLEDAEGKRKEMRKKIKKLLKKEAKLEEEVEQELSEYDE